MNHFSLRPHQQKFKEKNYGNVLLWHSCRSGKTLAASITAVGETIVLCPKRTVNNWKEHLPNALVLTPHPFKKIDTPTGLGTIIIDEVHEVAASPLYIAKERSAMVEKVYDMIKMNPNAKIMLLSATPLTNNVASLHTIMTWLGIAPNWTEFRNHFYQLESKPYMRRGQKAWFPKKDWRKEAYRILEKRNGTYVDIVTLEEIAPWLPTKIEEIVEFKDPKYIPIEDETWVDAHRKEQSSKVSWLLNSHFRKLIVAINYHTSIDEVVNTLKEHKQLYIVHGKVNNQEEVINAWQKDPDGWLIINSALGASFDGYMADALVYHSPSWRYVHYGQMIERLTTIDKDKVKPRLIYYLIGGKYDKKIHKSIQEGKDFDPQQE